MYAADKDGDNLILTNMHDELEATITEPEDIDYILGLMLGDELAAYEGGDTVYLNDAELALYFG